MANLLQMILLTRGGCQLWDVRPARFALLRLANEDVDGSAADRSPAQRAR